MLTTPISGTAQKYFIWVVEGKLCSKFGEDRSKTELTMLAVVAGWTDTGRTDGRTLKYFYILSNAADCIGQTITLASFPKLLRTKPWKSKFWITRLSFDASSPRKLREYPHKPYIARIYSHCAASLPLIVWIYRHSDFRGGLRKRMCFET